MQTGNGFLFNVTPVNTEDLESGFSDATPATIPLQ
jgi:hypothetical protein